MYAYQFPVAELSLFSKIPADTLRTWQRAENRKTHCELVEAAYQRSQVDPSAVDVLHQDIELDDFANKLGMNTPYPVDIGIPRTTLRQWEKDGSEFKVKIFLLGYQTLRINEVMGYVGFTSENNPLSAEQMMRLLVADQEATLILLRHAHYNSTIKN